MALPKLDLPKILSFSILLVQAILPWTVPYLSTLDGSSHLYSAIVARDLLIGQESHYATAYELNSRVVPNWGTTVFMNVAARLAGIANAEKLTLSLALLIGFFSLAYAIGGFSPGERWTPITNFLLQSWFLWIGFYSFYIGMVLSLLMAGYYVRVHERLTPVRLLMISLALAALFFMHLIGALVAAAAIGVIAVWKYFAGGRKSLRDVFGVSLAIVPLLLLLLLFASAGGAVVFKLAIAAALSSFPGYIFSTGDGTWGNQDVLRPILLLSGVIAVVGMRRAEWKSTLGGWVAVTGLLFLGYLILPDDGFGGGMVKIRFAWAVFLFLGVVLASSERVRGFRTPFAVVVTLLLAGNLVATASAARSASRVIEDYAPLAARIKPGASLVRMRYPTPTFADTYGYGQYGRSPLIHADAYFAANCRCVDLSDYEAISGVFPITLRSSFNDFARASLWALETPSAETSKALPMLLDGLPVRVDYVIVIADERSLARVPDLQNVLEGLESRMHLVGQTKFVRLYER